jgi:diguanylate cyclase (GGDEF)-like protein
LDSSSSDRRFSAQLLVVDDDDALLATICGLLTELGHTCVAAATADAALALLEQDQVDVMLADIRMPDTDGFGLLRQAKARWPELDVIMMTAYDMEHSYIDVIEAGASDFLAKPFRPDELQAKIQRILRERWLRAELTARSLHDSVSGLLNRRSLHQRLDEEVARSRRQHHRLSLIVLDVDRFKEYNDRFGHLEGDAVLAGLGRILSTSIRKNVDSAYRFGGDEFAVLLVESDLSQARLAAERIRRTFAEWSPGKCTVSVGLATLDGNESADSLLGRADQAMFVAKRAGGDRVHVLGEE